MRLRHGADAFRTEHLRVNAFSILFTHPMRRFFATVLATALCGGSFIPLLAYAEEKSTEWPFTRIQEEGLFWFWGHRDLTGEIIDAEGNWLREGELERRETARLTWFLGAEPAGGFLEAIDLGPALAQHLEEVSNLIFEMVLHPPRHDSPVGTLVWIGTFGEDLIWRIFVDEGQLMLETPSQGAQSLAETAWSEPVHLTVQVETEQVRGSINGVEAFSVALAGMPQFPDPWDAMVTFGGEPGEAPSWNGAMEYLAARHGDFSPRDGFAAWQEAHSRRESPESLTVVAELVQSAREPDRADLSEYGEGILAMVWQVAESAHEVLPAGDEILTWHWYFLDRAVIEEARPPAAGTRQTLRLTTWEANPQLLEVQQMDTDLEPDQLILLPQFFLDPYPTAE